ncbi:alpha/beta hydrolase [Herbaspirillum sp. LeCh32-8]|uniref:alpha/beta hydrolase n=1 Tax=Herbaspirillum sp. LeCh32-8 TaxID=2821356 RepID=UPI001AE59284|nr:alpha/beta hydrolase [Herbaspirillum sp. LeCh32-8]MBP0600143.1 alpha/beta hydrolase [Herbaspirillum sp. LeCh32-8]
MTFPGKAGLAATAIAAAIVLLGGLVACSPLTALNAITPASGYTRTDGIAYGEHPRQQLDIYQPRSPTAADGLPVVVFFYGGSWNDGSRKDYAFVGEALTSRGFIAVLPDYRVYPEVRYPEFVKDSAAAVAWTLRSIARYGGDPKKVFVMGHSAGAYNAAMVALDGRWLRAAGASPQQLRGWIGLAGPYDFLPIENPDVKPVFWFPDSPPDSQPIHHLSAAAPPALLIASHKDKLVEADRNTGGLARLLREKDIPVAELYHDNTSHASLVLSLAKHFRGIAPTLDEVAAFINAPPPMGGEGKP